MIRFGACCKAWCSIIYKTGRIYWRNWSIRHKLYLWTRIFDAVYLLSCCYQNIPRFLVEKSEEHLQNFVFYSVNVHPDVLYVRRIEENCLKIDVTHWVSLNIAYYTATNQRSNKLREILAGIGSGKKEASRMGSGYSSGGGWGGRHCQSTWQSSDTVWWQYCSLNSTHCVCFTWVMLTLTSTTMTFLSYSSQQVSKRPVRTVNKSTYIACILLSRRGSCGGKKRRQKRMSETVFTPSLSRLMFVSVNFTSWTVHIPFSG